MRLPLGPPLLACARSSLQLVPPVLSTAVERRGFWLLKACGHERTWRRKSRQTRCCRSPAGKGSRSTPACCAAKVGVCALNSSGQQARVGPNPFHALGRLVSGRGRTAPSLPSMYEAPPLSHRSSHHGFGGRVWACSSMGQTARSPSSEHGYWPSPCIQPASMSAVPSNYRLSTLLTFPAAAGF